MTHLFELAQTPKRYLPCLELKQLKHYLTSSNHIYGGTLPIFNSYEFAHCPVSGKVNLSRNLPRLWSSMLRPFSKSKVVLRLTQLWTDLMLFESPSVVGSTSLKGLVRKTFFFS